MPNTDEARAVPPEYVNVRLKKTEASAPARLAIFGAGGHAKVAADVARAMGSYEISAYYDDNSDLHGKPFYGADVRGDRFALLDSLSNGDLDEVFIAVGNNRFRMDLGDDFLHRDFRVATLVHPFTSISPSVVIGLGTVVMPGVAINADTEIGNHVILNTRCSVDHDCVIEAGAHIAPGVSLCGGVKVGKRSLIGVGASAKPNMRVGKDCRVGAGSAIVSEIPDGVTAVGVPARVVSRST